MENLFKEASMVRRLISTVVLLACAGIYTLAAERATLILTNGERRSGEVVIAGANSATFIDGHLKVIEGGNEQSIPIDQVAVIDFAGGRPSALELSRVSPHPGGQTAIMRSGHAQAGKFVNIVRGDTLLWENDKGQPEQYPLRDVSRVYLNPQSARTVYNNPEPRGPRGNRRGVATTGSIPGSLRVNANQAWTDTGLDVRQGDRVVFQASGQINYGRGADQTAIPDGGPDRRANTPDPTVPVGALIGKIGNSAPFGIGSQSNALTMPASGRLMIGVNDSDHSDNSGFFNVVVTRQ
jgi:hypothetical protein